MIADIKRLFLALALCLVKTKASLFLSLIVMTGCSTARARFQFCDAADGKPILGVVGEWYEDYTRLFSRTIWTDQKHISSSGENGMTEVVEFNSKHLNFFRFRRPGYGPVDGYLSPDGFLTGPGEKMVPTNHVILIPMDPEVKGSK